MYTILGPICVHYFRTYLCTLFWDLFVYTILGPICVHYFKFVSSTCLSHNTIYANKSLKQTHTNTHTNIHTNTHTNTHKHTHKHTQTSTQMHVLSYYHVLLWLYLLWKRARGNICMLTHTHKHTYHPPPTHTHAPRLPLHHPKGTNFYEQDVDLFRAWNSKMWTFLGK